MMVRDFNVKIGKMEHITNVVGKETVHDKTNDNGIRVSNFVTEINMILMSIKISTHD